MNRRQREILAQLQPAVDVALGRSKARADVPGLAMHKRVSADAPAEILIYGTIGGGGWFSDGISASDVAAQLREAGPGPVNVRINSGGGDVFDGVAIHSLLARHPGTVTVYVDGIAASAASFIMLAGDNIVAARNAFVMIHSAMTYTYGNPGTHRQAADMLDKVSDNIADMYAERAGEDAAFWRNLMDINGEDGTWYTGVEAEAAGLVDELTTVPDDEDTQNVARALTGWRGRKPVDDFLASHPAGDELDGEDDGPEDDDVAESKPGVPYSEPSVEPDHEDPDADFAHAMQMMHWRATNGHTARNGVPA